MARKHRPGDGVITKVRRWEVGKSKVKGTPYVRVQLDGYISWTGYITPNTTEKTMQALATMGFKGTNLKQLGNDNALDTNTTIVAVIGESREYNGKTYYNADWINKEASRGFDEKSKDLLDDFDIDTRAYIENTKDISKISESNTQQNTPTFTADDIPF